MLAPLPLLLLLLDWLQIAARFECRRCTTAQEPAALAF